MPLVTVRGRTVVDSGSFALGLEDNVAECEFAGQRFVIQIGAETPERASTDAPYQVIPFPTHVVGQQASVTRSGWEDGETRYELLITITGNAPTPDLRGAHIINYHVTKTARDN